MHNMLEEELIKDLTNSIKCLYDENGNVIPFKRAEVCYSVSPYSTMKQPTLIIKTDEKEYHKNRKVKVGYECKRCGSYNIIWIKKFLSKKQNSCHKCSETAAKKEWHSKVLKAKKEGKEIAQKYHKIKTVNYNFAEETPKFKIEYYKKHITAEQFDKIKKYIYSIDGYVIEGKNEIQFLEHEPCANQLKYRQMVLIDGKKVSLRHIKMKCKLCGKIYPIRRLLIEKIKKQNFYCNKCHFCNFKFQVQRYEDKLSYQGNTELKFIELCKRHNIPIINGETVEYYFNGKIHHYRIDFYLPTLKRQIEIKANHIWHKQQVKSGKWKAKEDAAIKFCQLHNMQFELLFVEDFDNFEKLLERDSQNSIER